MHSPLISQVFGRSAFGLDPAGYDAARPAYPEWVFALLRERCNLSPSSAVFEIGAGTGTATRRLLDLGANPLVAVEPDDRLAAFLRRNTPDQALTVLVAPFEDAVLPERAFDLGISATSFHWLNEDLALTRVAQLLRPGGWWAMFWNVFGDSVRPDPFHEATRSLLESYISPSAGSGQVPFALDTTRRLAALERTGSFDNLEHYSSEWSLILDADQTARLYATYSDINVRPDRIEVLNELRRIAHDRFGGRVVRNMTTILYLARGRS